MFKRKGTGYGTASGLLELPGAAVELGRDGDVNGIVRGDVFLAVNPPMVGQPAAFL
jgi:hypothetical protein